MLMELPKPYCYAWMHHARDLDIARKSGYVVTASTFHHLASKLNRVAQVFGVMDDFGDFKEVTQ